jgi:hypothetical protein
VLFGEQDPLTSGTNPNICRFSRFERFERLERLERLERKSKEANMPEPLVLEVFSDFV